MTKQEQGRRCGLARAQREREKARQRGIQAVSYAADDVREPLMALLRSGGLDRFLQHLEFHSYKRGYNKRDERVRRRAAAEATLWPEKVA